MTEVLLKMLAKHAKSSLIRFLKLKASCTSKILEV